MKRTILFLIIIISGLSGIAAQVQPACRIVYADGEGFTVVKGAVQTYYDLFRDDVLGLELRENDIVITESDTRIELQVASSNNIIKISENSSFKIQTFEEKGGGLFSISYGRLRAKVEKISGTQSFRVEGISAVCGVRGTDFGYDLIADPSGMDKNLITRIYCFSGSVEVETIPDTAGEGITELLKLEQGDVLTLESVPDELVITSVRESRRIILNSNEMVSISPMEPDKLVFSDSLPEEVVSYWDTYNFITRPRTIITLDEAGISLSEKQFRDKKRMFWGGMGLVLAGASLELTSFFIRNVIADKSSLTFSLSVSGAILMGSGFTGVGASYLLYK